MVFPTPVGVFPYTLAWAIDLGRLPHARGGVSLPPHKLKDLTKSSPRPWGCFPKEDHDDTQDRVFHTPVGVFP